MHSCPDCGEACYCNGDLDDIEMTCGERNCRHYLSPNCIDTDHDEDFGEFDDLSDPDLY